MGDQKGAYKLVVKVGWDVVSFRLMPVLVSVWECGNCEKGAVSSGCLLLIEESKERFCGK